MAITDYNTINSTIYHVTEERVPDGTGGFEQAYVVGESFKGSFVKSSSQEQMVAGIRGDTEDQYSLTAPKDEPIDRNDILMLRKKDNGRQLFLRVNSEPLLTPESSTQSGWKGFTAAVFDPRDVRVVDNGAD